MPFCTRYLCNDIKRTMSQLSSLLDLDFRVLIGPISQQLGIIFKSSRIGSGLSLQNVAANAGLEPSQLAGYEDGVTAIPAVDIFAISNALNLDPDLVINTIQKYYVDCRK